MEQKPLSVHFDMEASDEHVQNMTFSAQKQSKRGEARSLWLETLVPLVVK
jgi:hypothetical protein